MHCARAVPLQILHLATPSVAATAEKSKHAVPLPLALLYVAVAYPSAHRAVWQSAFAVDVQVRQAATDGSAAMSKHATHFAMVWLYLRHKTQSGAGACSCSRPSGGPMGAHPTARAAKGRKRRRKEATQ